MVKNPESKRTPLGRTTLCGLSVVLMGLSLGLGGTAPEDEVPATQAAATTQEATQNRGAIIPIRDIIDDVTASSLKRRAEEAIADGANVLILELDTPGGYVSSAVDIAKYIRKLSGDRGIKVVAWVRDEAISGGTMISMACDEIIMSRSSHLGDCGVIQIGAGGASTVQDPALDAKIESYVLTVFRSAASRLGYDPLLCESFVRYEIEAWWLENTTTGERRFVSTDKKEELLKENEQGGWTSKLLEGTQRSEWRLIENYVDPLDGKEKTLIQPVVSGSDLLTMDQTMAMVLGFSKKIVANEKELQEHYDLAPGIGESRFERMWSENFVSWLTSPVVRLILMALVGLGAYTEFKTPGIGVPGLVAILALMVLIGAPYVTGLANFWEIVVIVIGIILIAVEVFVIPGFGLAGIAGMFFVLVGLLSTFMPEAPMREFPIHWPRMTQSLEGLKIGVTTMAGAMVITVVGMVMISRYLPQMPYLNRLVPANPTPDEVAVDDPYEGLAMVGDLGVSESALRPAGKARFGSRLVDVVTEGDLIDPGINIEVIERHGNRVVVRKVT